LGVPKSREISVVQKNKLNLYEPEKNALSTKLNNGGLIGGQRYERRGEQKNNREKHLDADGLGKRLPEKGRILRS